LAARPCRWLVQGMGQLAAARRTVSSITMSQTFLAYSLLALSGMLLPSARAGAQPRSRSSAKPLLLVVNQGDRNLSLIDPATGQQVAAVLDGDRAGHAHEVAASPDGRYAYLPIYGNSGVGMPGSSGSTMLVVDIPMHKVIHTVNFGHPVRPHLPIYDPNTGRLYVTTELDKSVTIIDPKTLKIIGSVPTGQEQSHMLVIAHDGRRGYTANVGPGTVSVLDMMARKTIAVIPVSANIQRISISKDDSMVFTADQTKPQLAVIDTAANNIKAWVPLPAVGYGTAATRDGRWLLVTMPRTSQVAVVDLRTLKVAHTIGVPKGPTEILPSPDGRVAYVACGGAGEVAVIDLSQWKVQSVLKAGRGADGLAWAQ